LRPETRIRLAIGGRFNDTNLYLSFDPLNKIRIAGGEMNRRWHDYQEMNMLRSLDVYQPDAVLAGGITMVKKIAEWAQAHGLARIPGATASA
jgi:L-alanine-DL-glutamate epimerase-like enolase superfamily enzyme